MAVAITFTDRRQSKQDLGALVLRNIKKQMKCDIQERAIFRFFHLS